MGLITLPNTIASGDSDDPSRDMANWTTIRNLVNGQLDNDNMKADAGIAISKTTLGTFIDWTTFNPNRGVSGGTAPTYTQNDLSYYSQIGKVVYGKVLWSNLSGGTAGSGTNQIAWALPVTAANIGTTRFINIGTGFIFESGGTTDLIEVVLLDTTQAVFGLSTGADVAGNDQSSASRFIRFTFMYEAA